MVKVNKQEKAVLKNKITNDNTNLILQNSETKKYNQEIEEDKKQDENTRDIIIKTNKFNDECSVIEEKLPNPYLETDILGNKKYITCKVNSKYKSKFADYYSKKRNNSESIDKKKIKQIKTHKYSDKFDKHINFTNLKTKYRAMTNKISYPQILEKNIIIEEKYE